MLSSNLWLKLFTATFSATLSSTASSAGISTTSFALSSLAFLKPSYFSFALLVNPTNKLAAATSPAWAVPLAFSTAWIEASELFSPKDLRLLYSHIDALFTALPRACSPCLIFSFTATMNFHSADNAFLMFSYKTSKACPTLGIVFSIAMNA